MSETSFPLPIEELEKKINYTFKDKSLLTEALTHSSYINEHGESRDYCNERLEFLGDSVLSLAVSKYLFSNYSSRQEGDMTKYRAAVVCEKALAKFAKEIDLGDYLLLGKGEEKTNGRQRASITSDAYEALLAAMYIDSGYNCELVFDFVLSFVEKEIESYKTNTVPTDYKTQLQQIVQQAYGEKLEYVVVREEGPDHDKMFWVDAKLNSNIIGSGKGSTKRAAEQNAAKVALELFDVKSE